jgi:hypothetical protein
MVLTYDAYSETLESQKEKESEVPILKEKYEQDMKSMRCGINEYATGNGIPSLH